MAIRFSNFGPVDRQRMLAAMGMVRESVAMCMSVELPDSPRARKCRAVQDSIDALAADLTGDPAYYESKAAAASLMIRS